MSIPGSSRYEKGGVLLFHRLGATPETAYSDIVDILGASGLWTSSHRGDGQASLGMIAVNPQAKYFQSTYPFGPPRPSVEIDGAAVWDFRDPDQDPDDPSTWGWSRNRRSASRGTGASANSATGGTIAGRCCRCSISGSRKPMCATSW